MVFCARARAAAVGVSGTDMSECRVRQQTEHTGTSRKVRNTLETLRTCLVVLHDKIRYARFVHPARQRGESAQHELVAVDLT